MKSLRLPLTVPVWMLALMMAATPLLADEPPPAPVPHVRPLSADARDLVAIGLARSELIRNLIDHLDASDLVVYVDLSWFMADRTGQLTFIGSAGGVRYAMIRIACGHILPDALATLGHELRHGVEVADAPAVVGRASFASHYARIGRDLGRAGVSRQYETTAAVEAGRHVTRELAETVASSKAGGPMTSRNHHADVP
jgi:hypothetical protein